MNIVIVFGSQKCGTTSLFNYLSKHPRICPSKVKQTYYFMPHSYFSLNENVCFGNFSKTDFRIIFSDECEFENSWLLEATPDYLNISEVAHNIKCFSVENEVERLVLIGILRHPVERFISWYRFAIQQGVIKRECSLSEFIKLNETRQRSAYEEMEGFKFALVSGKYSHLIPNYLSKFPNETLIFEFEKLKREPNLIITNIFQHLDLPSELKLPLANQAANKTIHVRNRALYNLYMRFRRVYLFLKKTKLSILFEHPARILRFLYHKVNEARLDDRNLKIKQADLDFLYKYYEEDILYCRTNFKFDWDLK